MATVAQISFQIRSEATPQVRRYCFTAPGNGREGLLVKTKDEFYNRMRVVFYCAYYRCHHCSEEVTGTDWRAQSTSLSLDVPRYEGNRSDVSNASNQDFHTSYEVRHLFLLSTLRGAKCIRKKRLDAVVARAKYLNSVPKNFWRLSSSSGALCLFWIPMVSVVTGE